MMSRITLALFAVLMLSACADSLAPPVAVQALATDKKKELRISDVSAEASPGVPIAPFEMDRIVQRIKIEIGSQAPNALVNSPAAEGTQPVRMRVVFTQYDRGNSFARFMLAGLGQIHIDADVLLMDGINGEVVGRYKVSKDFSFGGVYGGSTKIEDVEVGFAKSVAAVVSGKTS